MAEADPFALAAAAEAEGLESLLVGGNAVNLYAYRRTTFDVDLLIREEQCERWIEFFGRHGFGVYHRAANFVRMHFAADPPKTLPVDLMLADEQTFRKLQRTSHRQLAASVKLAVPSALHLIAMKLHALKNQARMEHRPDFEDMIHLIKTAKIDIRSPDFREIVERYASEPIRSRIEKECDSGERGAA
jgi:hypothetical protein